MKKATFWMFISISYSMTRSRLPWWTTGMTTAWVSEGFATERTVTVASPSAAPGLMVTRPPGLTARRASFVDQVTG
ncbi:hypothetical protein D3C72_2360460 [compost metagenome]